jgi:hypothetical protein
VNKEAMSQLERRFSPDSLPHDISALCALRDELTELTGWSLYTDDDEPWNDDSGYDRSDPEHEASYQAMEATNALIVFVAKHHEEDEYLGFWRGPEQLPVSRSPLVHMDDQGLYELIAANTFTDALYDLASWDDTFKEWLSGHGLALAELPEIKPTSVEPDDYSGLVYQDALKPNK